MKYMFRPLFALIGALSAIAPASSATFNVTSLKDDGGSSELRWAITQANAVPGSTISFANGLSGTATLTSALPTIKAGMTIQGPGAALIAIDGDKKYCPFTLDAPGSQIKLSGLTIRHSEGGAIMDLNGVLSLIGCALTENNSHGGGALNCNGNTVSLTNCVLTQNNGNTSYGGGAIYDYTGDVTLVNCTLSGNMISGDASGGAIRNDLGTVTLTHCTLSENSTTNGGGNALANYYGYITLTDCMISGNKTSTGSGGAIINAAGIATISNCVFTQNNGFNGGAIRNNYTLTMTNCTFTNNDASYGGAIFNDDGALKLSNCILYGDTSPDGLEIAGPKGANVTYCDIEGGYAGIGNLNVDPLFVRPVADLHLQPGSPCRGTGTPTGAPAASIDGKTRPTPPSMGAYEVEPAVIVKSSLNPSYPGNSVTFTATVNAAPSIPTGTVIFAVGNLRETVALNRGVATFTTTSLTAGSYNVAALYSGDTAFAAASSAPLVQAVYSVPTVIKVSPNAGPLAGGTAVTISGTQFGPHSIVTFGTVAAADITVVSPTSITCRSPKNTAGTVNVTVSTPAGKSPSSAGSGFTYNPIPTVTGVAPSVGPLSGGTTIMITGSGFIPGIKVNIGTLPATNITVASPTSVTCKTPKAVSAGTVNVIVTTPGGTSATSASAKFAYFAPPTITSFTPASGQAGAVVTITGTNFTGATAVTFYKDQAATFKVVSATTITATVPAGAGSGPITVTTPGGTATSKSFTLPVTALSAFIFAPATILRGGSTTATVTLTAPAPVGGAAVTITQGLFGFTLTVPGGATTASTVINAAATTPAGSYAFTAAYAGKSLPATLTIK